MKASVEAIGPRRAKELLKLNDNFRKPNQMKIGNMARDMKSGQWEENGNSICLYQNGKGEVLKDGQNRLLAIIQSGTTQKFVVVRGIGGSMYIDTGEKRTLPQYLAHEGVPYASAVASIISNLIALDMFLSDRDKTGWRSRSVSQSERIACFKRDGKAISKIVGETFGHRELQWKAAVSAVLIRGKAPRDYLAAKDDFIECLRFGAWNGEALDPHEATFVLRELQTHNFRHRVRYSQRKRLALVVKAWNYHRAQELMETDKLRFIETGPTAESFPRLR